MELSNQEKVGHRKMKTKTKYRITKEKINTIRMQITD